NVENTIIQNSNAGIMEFSGDGIIIQRDLFRNIAGTNAVAGDAIYDDFPFTNLTITNNDILSSGQPITIPASPSSPPASVNITYNKIENGSFLWSVTGSFSHNTV